MARGAKYRIEGEDATGAAFRSVLGNAKSTANQMSGMFKAAFAGISAAAIVNAGREAIKLGDDLNKAAIKAGIGGQAISELSYAANLADVELSSLSTALKKMQVALSEANSGGKEQIKTLDALGLSIKDLQGLDADKQFEMLADQISRLKDPADRTRAAVELFGKAGADLLPMFEQGAAGIRKAREEAIKLGAVLTNEQIKKLADADDAVKKLDKAWTNMWAHFWAGAAGTTGSGGLTDFFNTASGVVPDQQRISELRKQLEAPRAIFGLDDGLRADYERQLAFLESRQNLHPELGGRGRPTHSGPQAPSGYGAEAATEEANKAAAADLKEREKWAANYRDLVFDLNGDFGKIADQTLKDDMEREVKRLDMADEYYDTWMENEKKLADFREEQSKKLSESAQIFKDVFTQAFDDMLNTGKIQWDELLKYMLARFAQMQFDKMLDSIFNGSNGGGFWSQLLGAFSGSSTNSNGAVAGILASMIPARAGGGPVSAGSSYLVGEYGAEVFRPRMSGSIIPNGAIGGGMTFAPVYNIDNRGATQDAMAMLPGILKRNNEQLKADVIQGIRSGRYPIGAARG